MKLRMLVSFATMIAVAASMNAAAFAQAKPAPQHFFPDIKIDQCFVTQPKLMSKKASGTQIVYENIGHNTYSSLTFAVGTATRQAATCAKSQTPGRSLPA